MSKCILCDGENDLILESFDLVNFVLMKDYWCPQCHTTETAFYYADGSVSNNYIQG